MIISKDKWQTPVSCAANVCSGLFGKECIGAVKLSSHWERVIDGLWLSNLTEAHERLCLPAATCRSHPSRSFLCQLSVQQSQVGNTAL